MGEPTSPPSLRELQNWTRWVVTDPRGVAAALNDPSPRDRVPALRYLAPEPNCLGLIEGKSTLEKARRLSVYAEAYFTRLLESLMIDFPLTLRALGSDGFTALIAEYLKFHPSRVKNIGEVGFHLCDFVKVSLGGSQLPGLQDLIQAETHALRAYYAADLPAFDFGRLAHMAEADWDRARIVTDPSVSLQKSDFNLVEFFTDPNCERLRRLPHPELLITYRRQNVVVRRIEDAAYRIILASQAGKGIASILEQLPSSLTEGLDFLSLFRSLATDGVIQSIDS